MYLAKLYKDINYLDNMRKILLFTSILFLTISTSLFAQHPTNLVTSNITSTSADLSCNATVCTGNIHYRYKLSSSATWTQDLNVNANTHSIVSLTSDTMYDWSVKCAGTGGWQTSVTFTTDSVPRIDTVFITAPITCFDSSATIQVLINQTNPVDTFKLIYGQMVGSYFVSFGAAFLGYSPSQSFAGLNAGAYVVRIVDSIPYYTANPFGNGTSTVGVFDEWTNFIVTEPDLLVASTITIDSNQCAGDCIATQELTITGGTQPYNYTLDANPIVILGPQSYDILTAGTTFSPNSLTINVGDTVTWTNTAGSHNVNATLGTYPGNPEGFGNGVAAAPWSFQWVFTIPGAYDYQCDLHASSGMVGVIIVSPTPSSTSIETLTNLCAGVYNLVVSDANGCLTDTLYTDTIIFAIDTITQIVPAGTTPTISLNFHISCNGGSDGVINASASGGTGAFIYSIDGGNFSTDNLFDSLIAGIYTITYRDANGCETTEQFTLNEPPALTGLSAVTTSVSCFGGNNGEITFTVTPSQPGVFPYQYSTDNGVTLQGSNVFTALFGDSIYGVMIEDAHGCQFTYQTFLAEPTEIFFSPILSDSNGFEVSCFEALDGIIDFGAPWPAGVYEFSIDSGINYGVSSLYPTLPADTYYLSVQDGAGCTKDTTVILNSPLEFVITPVVTSNYNGSQVSCNGVSDGEITVTSQTNGVDSINYGFDGGAFSADTSWNSLSAGSYTVYAEDANGCVDSSTITITPPPALTATTDSTFEFCNHTDGMAEVFPSGGTGAYSFSWNDPSNTQSSQADSLDAGTYFCVITDANWCNITETVIVADSIPFVLNLTTTPTCPGLSPGSGSATVNIIPLGGYIYLWDDPFAQSNATATGLALGNYTVAVTELICTISGDVYVDTPSVSFSIDNIDVTHITCRDADDGSIEINAIGGLRPFQYLITPGIGTQQPDSIFSNLIEGEYSVQVFDATGCTGFDTIAIINPDSLIIDTIIVNPITCAGGSDASIQAIVGSGGTPPYMYSVEGSPYHSNMSYFNSYSVGSYTVVISDINECYSEGAQLTINEPDSLLPTITTSLWNNYQIKCNEDSSGFADITVTGGVGPYIYTVLDFNGDIIASSPNSYIDSLFAGTYTFEITDANGCTYPETITYFEPPEIQHHFIVTHVNCSGWNNGALVDSVSGGVGSATTYSYLWNNGETTHTIDSLFVGWYNITVTDENNCVSSDLIEVNDNDMLQTILTPTDVSCFNFCDGEIMATVTGGAPNDTNGIDIYYYLWNDTLTQTSQTALGLCANNVTNSATYTCVITDNQGCSISLSETILQQDELIVTPSILTEISCNLENDGSASVSVSGGNSPYDYLWNNTQITATASGLTAGNYIIIVEDDNGCFGDTSILLSEPSELTLTFNEINITCYGFNDGKITADADGGTPFLNIPPEYLYTFYNALGTAVFFETTDISTVDGLNPGIYTIVAEDRNGCKIESGTIYISEPGDSLTISFNTINESCMLSNGEVNVDVYGGTSPYQYDWSNGAQIANIVNLASGFYPITITDDNGCIITDSAFVKGVHNVFLPDNLNEIEFTICLGESIYLDIDEYDGTSYEWENGSIIADRWVYPGERINNYNLTIYDSSCAAKYTVTATVYVDFVDPQPSTNPLPVNGPYPTIVKGESIEIFSDNMNCDTYEWSWIADTVGTRIIIPTPEASGWYHIAVDSAGCLGLDSVYVVVGVKLYDAITPNGDGFNDVWNVLDIASYPNAVVQVFNRWGALVHETLGGVGYIAWDGTRNGKELPIGTYYYVIDLNTGDEPQSGPITIIR